MKKKNRVSQNVAAVLTMLLFIIAAAAFLMWNLDHVIANDIVRILDVAALHSADTFHEKIETDLNSLKSTAIWVENNSKSMDFSKIANELEKEAGNFTHLSIADRSGKLYDSHGMRNISQEEKQYLSQLTANNVILASAPCSSGENRIITAFAPVEKSGKVIGAVIGSYSSEDFQDLYHKISYPYSENIRIIRCNGDILQLLKEEPFQNAFTFLKANLNQNLSGPTQMSQNMQNGKSGNFLCKLNGVKTLIHYVPVRINDWYLLFITPMNAVSFHSIQFLRYSVFIIILISSVLIMIMIFLLLRQQKNQLKLQRLRKELSVLYSTLPGGIIRCKNDDNLTIIYASKGFYHFLGYSKKEFEDQFRNQAVHVLHPDDYEKIKANHSFLLTYGSVLTDEYRVICANGIIKWIWLNTKLAEDSSGEKCFYNTFADITPLKEAQENLLINQRLYDIVLDQTQDSIFEWNILEQTIYFSKNFLKKFGYQPSSSNFPECVMKNDNIPKSDLDSFRKVCQNLMNGDKFTNGEFRIKKADGSLLWCSLTATAILDKDGKAYKAVGILSDIDTQKRTLQTVKEYAQKDSLTGLYNKGITENRIRSYIEQNKDPAALIVIDIDNFKKVNDTLGHLYGDTALKEIARAIKTLFRSTDIIGRIGGDEFIVFLEHISDEFMVHKKVHKITEIFQHSFEKTNVNYKLTVSVGVAFYPKDASNFPELFDKADIALYYAKNHGKNQFAVYCEKVEEANSLRSQQKNGLRLY